MAPEPVPTSDLVDRLRREARSVLLRSAAVPFDALVDDLRPVLGATLPGATWIAAALEGEPALWRLPDGRWLHLGTAVYGRCFTTVPVSGGADGGRDGVLPGDDDLQTALSAYRGWTRIPIRTPDGDALADVVPGRSGRLVLVIPRTVMPTEPHLLIIVPGPEGFEVTGGTIDEVATHRLVQALGHVAATAVADGPDTAWTPTDLELAALCADPVLRTTPTAPLTRCLAAVQARTEVA